LYSIPAVPPDRTAPTLLVDQLNFFAGELCFREYETRVCRFLCAYANDFGDEGYFGVQNDGFVEPASSIWNPTRTLFPEVSISFFSTHTFGLSEIQILDASTSMIHARVLSGAVSVKSTRPLLSSIV
ncbi:hypothetical protein SCLCIDRAFT_110391, partial [Scleroderma citrinum Foug A]